MGYQIYSKKSIDILLSSQLFTFQLISLISIDPWTIFY
uniref:Uncharacterized protein n=1 Tax=Arundo donax TaxID=35708 RepID=A0A0A9BUH3_ARUDO